MNLGVFGSRLYFAKFKSIFSRIPQTVFVKNVGSIAWGTPFLAPHLGDTWFKWRPQNTSPNSYLRRETGNDRHIQNE
jgi:hypothetical protein